MPLSDVTPRESARQADVEMRAASRARVRRVLQAALIHDLKAPLNAATLVVDLLARSLAKDDGVDPAVRRRQLENVEEIRREIRRIVDALPGLLSLADPGEEAAQPFDVVAALEEALDLLRQQILLRGARLHRRFPAEPVVVVGSPSEIQHAVVNVVLNALEATPRGGEVGVVLERRAGGFVHLRIEDCGEGIPPADRERVFEPRVSTRPGRQGFGLPVARGILADHGGTIRLVPGDAGGTVALIDLPVAGASATTTKSAPGGMTGLPRPRPAKETP